jgi:hypothetical protein
MMQREDGKIVGWVERSETRYGDEERWVRFAQPILGAEPELFHKLVVLHLPVSLAGASLPIAREGHAVTEMGMTTVRWGLEGATSLISL